MPRPTLNASGIVSQPKIRCSSHRPGCTLWSEAENWASRGPVPTAASTARLLPLAPLLPAFMEWLLPPCPCFCACSHLLLSLFLGERHALSAASGTSVSSVVFILNCAVILF